MATVVLYVLEGLTFGKRYVGITCNLPRRLAEHRSHSSKAGQLLGEFRVVYTENHPHYASARQREKFFKSSMGRRTLLALIPRSRPVGDG